MKVSKGTLKQLLVGLSFVSPYLIGFILFTLYPIVASFYYSFCDYEIFSPPQWIGTKNYTELFSDPLFLRSIFNTLYYAIFAVPVGVVMALLLALLLNKKVKGMSFYRTIFFLPSIVPMVASAVLWAWMFNYDFGVLNSILRPILFLLGKILGTQLSPPGWLSDPSWSKPSLILMSLWGIGGTMVLYLASLQDVPRSLYDAAEVDGASAWQKTWHITLPMISPVIFFNVVMGIIGSLQVFTQAFIMTNGGPGDSTLFYALYLFNNAFMYFHLGYASAMAWILFIVILLVTLLVFKGTGRFVYYSGGEEEN